jgi:DNA-binding CsgD family transcriptional regulator
MLSLETPFMRANARARLTARQKEIADLLGGGLSCREISFRLGIAYETVRVHSKSIHRKFGVHTNAQLMHKLHSEEMKL